MPDNISPRIPPTHRLARSVILAALAGVTLLAELSGPVDRAIHAVLHADQQVTTGIWRPILRHGGSAAPAR